MIKLEYRYEYETIETLKGDAARNIRVPKSIIVDTDMQNIRLAVFSYMSIYKGLNNKLCFSIPSFLNWAGYKSDAHGGGVNDKVIETVKMLSDLGYITFVGNGFLTRSSCVELLFNTQLVHDICCEEGFAVLYLDEIEKIMQYENNNKQDRYLNRNTVLLVFAFLRQAIFRTPNELKPEERSPEGIAKRRERCIEAYNNNYKDIAARLGLSNRTVSMAAEILMRLGLIAIAEAYHIKNEDGDFRTPDFIFANMEKREGKKLLAKGQAYATGELKRKEASIKKIIPDYKVKSTFCNGNNIVNLS